MEVEYFTDRVGLSHEQIRPRSNGHSPKLVHLGTLCANRGMGSGKDNQGRHYNVQQMFEAVEGVNEVEEECQPCRELEAEHKMPTVLMSRAGVIGTNPCRWPP